MTDSMHYGQERDFRLRLLAMATHPSWYTRYGTTVLRPAYFEADDEAAIAKALGAFWEEWGHVPDRAELLAYMNGAHAGTVAVVYNLAAATDLFNFEEAVAVKFAKGQALRTAILASADDLDDGNLDAPLARVAEAMRVGEDLTARGTDLIADALDWVTSEIFVDKFSTGMPLLDAKLDGGLARTELGVLIAPPNRGKTMGLVNLGYGAANALGATDVVHVTLEMRESAICKRYAARMLRGFLNRHEDKAEEYVERLRREGRRLLRGRVIVKGFPSNKLSVPDLDAYLRSLCAEGLHPGVLIVDYADLLRPTHKYNEKRFELGDIYRDLRSLADGSAYNMAIWTATQSNRDSLRKEIVGMGDIAESFEKAAIADVLVALSQTKTEYAHNQARLYLAKVRDNKAQGLLRCKFISERMYIMTDAELVLEDQADADTAKKEASHDA